MTRSVPSSVLSAFMLTEVIIMDFGDVAVALPKALYATVLVVRGRTLRQTLQDLHGDELSRYLDGWRTEHVPAVIVERVRPWLITPSYEATGYNYGRVHLAREMREGVVRILMSALPHATYSYTLQLGTSILLHCKSV